MVTRIMQLERERDQLREANCKLRDRLLAVAKACPACDGTGLVGVFEQIDPDDITKGCREAVQECGDCLDIREALA